MQRIRIWDLPTRVFHWALALCVVGSFVTVKIGGNAMVWHGRIGVTVVGLLAFRLVWGFVGSTYARFSQFVRGPRVIKDYIRGQWQGEGHNPLGALSVLATLGTLLLLVATGLFANDDIAFEGPLYALVGKEFSDRVAGIHRLIEPLTILLVLAHLGAIVYYVSFKKETLIMPMITGWKVMRSGIPGDGADTAPALQGGRARNALLAVADGETAQGGGALAFCFALAIALGAAYGASGAWIASPPSTAAPAAAPNW